jgi:hypothetical protein
MKKPRGHPMTGGAHETAAIHFGSRLRVQNLLFKAKLFNFECRKMTTENTSTVLSVYQIGCTCENKRLLVISKLGLRRCFLGEMKIILKQCQECPYKKMTCCARNLSILFESLFTKSSQSLNTFDLECHRNLGFLTSIVQYKLF